MKKSPLRFEDSDFLTFSLFDLSANKFVYSQVPIQRVGPNKQVGWIFKYIDFIKEYVEPNKRVEWKIC